ncbi:hypothetical protein Amsp01_024500 [Amycolatopsis sp. NBRC 101858]|uniref:hypothetical protein n=1 Tax=Amycolatopsis sp. NBRC 101858 TaxID=3032200 RepID=UPI0024A44C3F|nr:hypothetical protein [Amycolatopsis sp. NBRC 101858]GLY36426.1 hypothetical protein Amsp01_024500 [Amycolatopsis sp. NBRC 101858]
MTYGTLAFRRHRYTGVKITDDGESRYVNRETAADYYAKTVIEPANLDYQRELERRRKARSKFMDSAVIHEPPATWKERKRLAGSERVTLDGVVHTVPAGQAERFIRDETARRFPALPKPETVPFDTWFQQNSEERRVWQGLFITADTTEALPGEIVTLDDHGYPISEALGELNKRKQEGWRLVHVSEDHGLYNGADSHDEAYLTRVRYLLEKD